LALSLDFEFKGEAQFLKVLSLRLNIIILMVIEEEEE